MVCRRKTDITQVIPRTVRTPKTDLLLFSVSRLYHDSPISKGSTDCVLQDFNVGHDLLSQVCL